MVRLSNKRVRTSLGSLALALLLQISLAKDSPAEGDATSQTQSPPLSFEISLDDLEYYVKTEDGRNILKTHYHSVPEGQRSSWIVGTLPENEKKNRYDDLPAYDRTRVILETTSDDNSSDYINANYINGYYRGKEYVATQGPLPNTINDFWRLIWQLKTHKIVMLANVMEHGQIKVEKYWPETNATYGELVVKKMSEHSRGNHVIRTFLVRKVGDIRSREVRQFHYTGWPDLGVPSDRLSVISLVWQARKYRAQDLQPMVVHCSAGVGRTGTVILMDSMIQKADNEDKVDFVKRLDEMRDQRINVVEKEDQYIFAHEAVYEMFKANGTEAYLKDIDEWYQKTFYKEASNVADPTTSTSLPNGPESQ